MGFLPVTAVSRQLLATLGPASFASTAALTRAGATCLRLNASHVQPGELRPLVERARAAAPGVPLVIDLQGAKMRLGLFDGRAVCSGQRLRFSLSGNEPGAIPLPHAEIFAQTQALDTLSVDDGRLRLRTVAAGRDWLEADTLVAGRLLPRKGVNVLEHPVVLRDLSGPDRAALEALAGVEGLAWAFSFMVDGREAAWIRKRAPQALVIGKVERREALIHLPALADHCDAIWVCRGDLGAQLGSAGLARGVAAVEPQGLACPVLMAGQVLEHLTQHDEPTRSEVCHLFDLLTRGYAGVVLSDETAIGTDPVHAVQVASALITALQPAERTAEA